MTSSVEGMFRGDQRGRVPYGGGTYEVYVIDKDNFYVAGGTVEYRNMKKARRAADDWIESRSGVRAYVVQSNAPQLPPARIANRWGDGTL